MELNKEVAVCLKYEDENETRVFVEGDDVLCCVKNDKRYMGRILSIGNYQENETAEQELAIYINTSKSNTSFSGELIKVSDITYICKCPFNDLMGYPDIDEGKDKRTFVNMLIGLGFAKESAADIYDTMSENAKLYRLPFSTALSSAIYEMDISVAEKSEEERKNVINKWALAMSDLYQKILDGFKEKVYSEINKTENKD